MRRPALALLLATCVPSAAAAQETAEELRLLAHELGSDDPAARERAYEALGSLPPSSLPAIRERLATLRRARPDSEEETLQLLHAIRRATGSRRADDLVDVADGVPGALAIQRDRDMLVVAEPILLLRSLERMGTTEALEVVPEVLRLDRGVWQMEGRRLTMRLGDHGAAAMILARAHEDPAGREWSRWSARELQLEDPGRLVQRLEPRDLAEVLAAWGRIRSMDAMPVVASFVDDPRRLVRSASRDALREYGQNGIWQAREQYRLRLGESASEEWGWQRTLHELCQRLDQRRMSGVADLESAAAAAIEGGDLERAAERLDQLLARSPDASSEELGALFGRLGAAMGEGEGARAALERAIRVAPGHAGRAGWDARLALIDARESATRGVVDLERFRAAAAMDPACTECAAAASGWQAQVAVASDDGPRRMGMIAAAALLALVGLVLLRRPKVAIEEPVADGDVTDPSEIEIDALSGVDAETTLPG
jgi:MYXO-CTERM domain-containing protein